MGIYQKLASYLKMKGIEATADEMLQFIDEPSQITNLPQTDGLKHNSQIIEEMKATFQQQMESFKSEQTAVIEALKQENNNLLKALGEEKEARDKGQAALAEKLEKEKAERVESLIKKAVESQKIPAQNEELINKYKALAMANFEDAELIIESLPGAASPATPKPAGEVKPAGIKLDPTFTGIANPHFIKVVEEQLARTQN